MMKKQNIAAFSIAELTDMIEPGEARHSQEYFEIIWLKNGTGVHQIDMNDHVYDGSVLFFLAPGQVHTLTQHKKTPGYILRFLPALFKQERDFIDFIFDACLVDNTNSCPIINIPEEIKENIQEIFSRFSEEFNDQQPGSDIILCSYLKILTTLIKRIKNRSSSTEALVNKTQYDLFRKFKIAIEHNYKTKHTVQDYADHLQVQARTLNAITRKCVNKSALEVIQDRIILEAKRRLYHESKSIKELGYELGFEDPAYFTRFFKKNVGITPQHFKSIPA